MNLSVERADCAVRADKRRGVPELLVVVDLLDDAARDEPHVQLARERARPGERGAVDRLGAFGELLRRAEHVELLGQYDELGALRGRLANEPLGDREVALLVVVRVELYGRRPHCHPSACVVPID